MSDNNLWSGIAKILVAIGGLALISVGIAVFRRLLFVDNTPKFWFRQHWGGFGGGRSGWDASKELVMFAAGSILVVLGALVLVVVLGSGGGS